MTDFVVEWDEIAHKGIVSAPTPSSFKIGNMILHGPSTREGAVPLPLAVGIKPKSFRWHKQELHIHKLEVCSTNSNKMYIQGCHAS